MSTELIGGCVVFLLDESAGMNAVIQDAVSDGTKSTKTNAERVATALNSLLNQLASAAGDCEVALLGYQADAAGEISVGSRFGGSLVGHDFVRLSELAAAPLRVENRTRRLPPPGGFGKPREENVSFPVWYAPTLGAKAPQIAAYNACCELLSRWTDRGAAGASVVVHVHSGSSGDGNPQMVIDKLMGMSTPTESPIVFQIHLGATAQVVPALYPSNPQFLAVGSSRDLFRRSSKLPDHWLAALKKANVSANKGARAMLFNAKIPDVIRAFGLIKTHLQSLISAQAIASVTAPAAAPTVAPISQMALPTAGDVLPASTGILPAEGNGQDTIAVTEPISVEPIAPVASSEKAALIVLVLDRSVADPFTGNLQNPCTKLQDHANEVLKQISKLPHGNVETAIISYGLDSAGHVDIRTTFDGPLAGRTIVPQTELAAGALRTEEIMEEVSNGVGGLVTITRKKPIYLELEPTAAAQPTEAFAEVARIVSQWAEHHPTACSPPLVLHLTRGATDPVSLDAAVSSLQTASTAARPVLLYHLISTEQPHKSLAYPASDAELGDQSLTKLWEVTSLLLDRERLAAEKPMVSANSRGMVVNGKFDLLLDSIKAALAD